MRALSQRQAAVCETAASRRCTCRCGGAYHGANRQARVGLPAEAVVDFVVALPQEDAHYVPNKIYQPRLPAPVGYAA